MVGRNKKLYIDIYHTLMDTDGINPKKHEHLASKEVTSDLKMDDIVISIRNKILNYYNDGLYIEGEEFEDVAYLNIFLLFGNEYQFLIDYLETINHKKEIGTELINDMDNEYYLLIENVFEDEDYQEFQCLLRSYKIDGNIKSKKVRSFEKGAGDFEIQIMLALAISAPVLDYYTKKALIKIEERLGKKYRVEFLNVNPMNYKAEASKLAEEPERFLNFQTAKSVGKLENKLEIIFVTRNKRIILTIDKSNGNIINSEVHDKSQTGI